MNILDADGLELAEGQHNVKFSYQLPSTLPTSFKHKFGSIKYKLQVEVKFPTTSIHSELFIEHPFVIIQPINLNEVVPSLGDPIKIELEKSFNFNLASSDLNMMSIIPQGGYVVGQSIEVFTQVENLGKSKVKYLKISLKKIVDFKRLKILIFQLF